MRNEKEILEEIKEYEAAMKAACDINEIIYWTHELTHAYNELELVKD